MYSHPFLLSAILLEPEGEPLHERVAVRKFSAAHHASPAPLGPLSPAQERQAFVHDLALSPARVGGGFVEFIDRRSDVRWGTEDDDSQGDVRRKTNCERFRVPRSFMRCWTPAGCRCYSSYICSRVGLADDASPFRDLQQQQQQQQQQQAVGCIAPTMKCFCALSHFTRGTTRYELCDARRQNITKLSLGTTTDATCYVRGRRSCSVKDARTSATEKTGNNPDPNQLPGRSCPSTHLITLPNSRKAMQTAMPWYVHVRAHVHTSHTAQHPQ